MIRTFTLALGVALSLAARLPAEQPKPAAVDTEAVARRLWAVMELVAKTHVESPSRAAMVAALLKETGVTPPKDLESHVAGLKTADDFLALCKGLIPEDKKPKDLPAGTTEAVVVQSLVGRLPGKLSYIPAADLKVLEQINNNRYVGTGIQIRLAEKERLAEIMYCFPGSPARRAGAKPGDVIVQVDDKPIAKEGALQRTVQLLRGEEGTEVTMVVRQAGEKETRALKMVRAVVSFESVAGHHRSAEDVWDYRIDPSGPVAYVRITTVGVSTLHELRQLEKRLQADGCRALVLDLRFSAGEDMHHAEMVADGLLDGGVLWRVRDGQGHVRERKADRDCLFRDWPLAVLVNGQTRGNGGELVAAALKDRGRAVLVGEPTRGDWYERRLVTLPDGGGAVFMPVGVVERNDRGPVKPDYVIKMDKKLVDRWAEWQRTQELSQKVGEPAPEDPPLAKAVALLQEALKKQAKPEKAE